MIALAIMAGVVLTVISSFNYHLSLVSRDREETIAMLLARAKLEDPTFVKNAAGTGTFTPDWPGFAWKTEITPADFPGVTGQLNQLTMTVSWDDQRKNLSLVQYVAKAQP